MCKIEVHYIGEMGLTSKNILDEFVKAEFVSQALNY